MITGNPRTGKSTKLLVVVILLAIAVIAMAVLSMRKRAEPQGQPPLTPSVLIVPAVSAS